MNAPLTNLMMPPPTPTPKRSASVPAGRKAPEKPSLNRAAKSGAESPKSNSRPAADEKGGVRPKISAKAARKNSRTNHRAAGRSRKGASGDKTGKQVALADPNLAATVLDTQVNGGANPAGSTEVFATILQAAQQSGKTSARDASKTKATVSGGRKVTPGPAHEGKVTVQELASTRTAAQPSALDRTAAQPSVLDRTAAQPSVLDRTAAQPSVLDRTAAQPSVLEKTVSPVVTVPVDRGILRKALAPVVPGKVLPGKDGTAEKVASSATASGKNSVVAPKMVVTPGPAAQVSDQSHKAIQPDVVRGSETLRQSWLASAQSQSVVSAASKTGRPAKPNPEPAARNKVTLQIKSAQQAKVIASAAQGILHKRLGTLSHGADRQAQFVVKELTGQNSVVAGDTAPVDTPATEAVRPGVLAPGSPVKQIADAFRSSAARNGQEIVIRLNPPELGRVRVTLRVEGNEVRGILDVENSRTLSQLQREVPNIMSRLTDAGIEMKRMDLSLNEDGMRDSTSDSAWFSRQYGENGPGHGGWDAPGQGRVTDETLPGGPDAEGELPPALTTIGDDSINIWI